VRHLGYQQVSCVQIAQRGCHHPASVLRREGIALDEDVRPEARRVQRCFDRVQRRGERGPVGIAGGHKSGFHGAAR